MGLLPWSYERPCRWTVLPRTSSRSHNPRHNELQFLPCSSPGSIGLSSSLTGLWNPSKVSYSVGLWQTSDSYTKHSHHASPHGCSARTNPKRDRVHGRGGLWKTSHGRTSPTPLFDIQWPDNTHPIRILAAEIIGGSLTPISTFHHFSRKIHTYTWIYLKIRVYIYTYIYIYIYIYIHIYIIYT